MEVWKEPWKGAMEPFKVFGNLYFVGTEPASSHMIDTGDGLILIDTGYQHGLYLLIDNIYRLGFNPHDVKYILLTHGHVDHYGSAHAFSLLTGCKVAIGAQDRDYINGKNGLTWEKELGVYAEPFEADILLNDGDEIKLGNTVIKAVLTPGHTHGAMSYFFNVTDGKDTYRAAIPGGLGLNSLEGCYLDAYGLPYSLRDDFLLAMDRMAEEKVDIFLGNHVGNNNTPGKYEALKNGDKNAFIDPDGWAACHNSVKRNLLKLIEEEKK